MEIKDDTSTIFEPFNIEIAPTLLYAPVVSEIGDPLSVSPTVSPSVEAGSFTLVSGSLPTGLSLNSSSGAITGTPSETSNTALTIEYTTGQQTVNSQFTLQINGYQPSLTYPPFIGTPGQTVSLNPSLTGTKGAVTYTSGLPLPDGLSLNPATGVISGVVASNAVSAGIEIRVTDQYQQRASAGVVVSIGAASVPVPLLNTLSIFVLGLLISLVGLRRAGLLARFKRAR
jgi:hypothetical protein